MTTQKLPENKHGPECKTLQKPLPGINLLMLPARNDTSDDTTAFDLGNTDPIISITNVITPIVDNPDESGCVDSCNLKHNVTAHADSRICITKALAIVIHSTIQKKLPQAEHTRTAPDIIWQQNMAVSHSDHPVGATVHNQCHRLWPARSSRQDCEGEAAEGNRLPSGTITGVPPQPAGHR